MTREAHEKARVLVCSQHNSKQFPGYFSDIDALQEARNKAREEIDHRDSHNDQSKADLGITFEFSYRGLQSSEHDPEWYGDTWEVTGSGDFKMTYRTGVGHRICFWGGRADNVATAFLVPPSALDILHCIRLDNPHDETFENWCSEYGYDTDSRKAEKMYRACIEQTMMFRRNYPAINLDEYQPLEDY